MKLICYLILFLDLEGCVRIWDPSRAVSDVDNGEVVAEVNYDVSQFSVGDPFAGEHRLIM